jgi:hypothetical protein
VSIEAENTIRRDDETQTDVTGAVCPRKVVVGSTSGRVACLLSARAQACDSLIGKDSMWFDCPHFYCTVVSAGCKQDLRALVEAQTADSVDVTGGQSGVGVITLAFSDCVETSRL